MLSSFFCVDTTMQKKLPMKTLKKLPSKDAYFIIIKEIFTDCPNGPKS